MPCLFSSRHTVVVSLPRVGLGNCLLVWARAAVFAHLNGLPLQTLGWNQFRIGPWLRRERTKRFYGGYFRSSAPLADRLLVRPRLLLSRATGHLLNPPVEKIDLAHLGRSSVIVFDQMPHWKDWFRDLKAHRRYVRDRLFEELKPSIKRELDACPRPVIGVHVRLGDSRPLQPGENFATIGGRTPLEHFQEVIRELRKTLGARTPVTLFSDGYVDELRPLLMEPLVSLAPPRRDIVDMLLLARSSVIVASALSSFSYWSGFLSDAPLILHPEHIYEPIRAPSEGLFEGAVDANPSSLVRGVGKVAGVDVTSPFCGE